MKEASSKSRTFPSIATISFFIQAKLSPDVVLVLKILLLCHWRVSYALFMRIVTAPSGRVLGAVQEIAGLSSFLPIAS